MERIVTSLIVGSLAACVLAPSPGVAQAAADAEPDAVAILQVVDDLFDAMRARDGETLERIFHPNTSLITAGTGADGTPVVTEIPISRFVSSVLGSSSYLDERTYNPVVQVNGNLGTVWVEYDFFADGEFSPLRRGRLHDGEEQRGVADRPDRAHDGARGLSRARRLTACAEGLTPYPSSLPSSLSSSGTIRIARNDARR